MPGKRHTRRINQGSRAYFAFGVCGREYFNALNVCAHERARTWTGNILTSELGIAAGYELRALGSNECCSDERGVDESRRRLCLEIKILARTCGRWYRASSLSERSTHVQDTRKMH